MAASALTLPGILGGCYRNTGTYGSPTWTEQTSVKSGSIGVAPWEFGDASARKTRAKLFQKTQVDLSSEVMMLASPAAADYIAFYGAAQSATSVLDLLLINAKITTEGAIGIRSEFQVALAKENQEIEGVIYDTFELKPVATANGVPSSVVMGAASAPTIAAF